MVTVYKCASCGKQIKYSHASVDDGFGHLFCDRICWASYKARAEKRGEADDAANKEASYYRTRLHLTYAAMAIAGAVLAAFVGGYYFRSREATVPTPTGNRESPLVQARRHDDWRMGRRARKLSPAGIIEDEPGKAPGRVEDGNGAALADRRGEGDDGLPPDAAPSRPPPQGDASREENTKRRYLLARAKQSTDYGDAALREGNAKLARQHYAHAAQLHSQIYPDMVYVPPGRFTRGSDRGHAEEKPAATISLDGFWIDKYEVTNEMYRKFAVETGHRVPYKGNASGGWARPYNWNKEGAAYPEGKGRYPVVFVTWDDAEAYATWAGKRLPSEAEWEKAARGTDGRVWPWGNEWKSGLCNSSDRLAKRKLWDLKDWQAWYDRWLKLDPVERNEDTNMAVGSYPLGVSPYGAYDMAGNVYEWCQDWWDEDFYKEEAGRGKNPVCTVRGPHLKVMKGGSWRRFGSDSVRCAHRACYAPDRVDWPDIGFRCARSPGDGL